MDIDAFLKPLVLDDDRLRALAVDFSHTYRGLALNSTEQFLATPINVLPKGTETGRFLAIDVGGSNLRAGIVELLSDDGELRTTHERSWPIEDHFKMDNAYELFSWIGSRLALVASEWLEEAPDPVDSEQVLPLGITFSFPMMQASISEATLMPMGKGFAVTSELDLGTMLLDGYYGRKDYSKVNDSAQRLPEIKISAITNDTVATLASLAYSAHAQPSNRVAMGLIVGTGTNSSVIMKLKDLHEQKRASIVLPTGIDHSDAQVVVNTEWTIKGAAPPLHRAGLITRWDRKLDESCEAPGFQPFEYMTAGRYLGELARLILLDYLRRIQQVPGHLLPVCLLERNAIDTMFLSELAACDDAVGVLAKLQSRHPIQEDSSWRWDEQCAILLLKTARALQQRSARMISAAAIGLLVSTGDLRWEDGEQNAGLGEAKSTCEEIIIAFAGGVITSCPEYLSTMQQTIDDLVRKLARADRHQRVILRDANNGGLLGAGVLAGTVWHLP